MSKDNARNVVLRMANHWKVLAAVFVFSLLIPAGIYAVIEPYTFIQSLEWAAYMITSTGLGSHGATTLLGQLMGIGLMIWGPVIMLALVTGMVVNALRVDPNAFTHEEQEEILSYVRDQRAKEKAVARVWNGEEWVAIEEYLASQNGGTVPRINAQDL